MSATQKVAILIFVVFGFALGFRCPEPEGHFADEDDCALYHHCANNVARSGFCPAGLFFSRHTGQCDWPSKSGCEFTPQKARKILRKNPVKVYLTFDDGPGAGTEEVLDSLRDFDVPATFFINSDQLVVEDLKKPKSREKSAESLIRTFEEGHVLADHSYDHMKHNSNGPQNAYMDVENDLSYFGRRNSHPALTILRQAGFDETNLHFANYTLSTIARMPYSNNWRAHEAHKGFVRHNCEGCTVPARSSGARAMRIADLLAADGVQLFGWDLEWNMNFNVNRLKYGGESMFQRLGSAGNSAKVKGKVVVLAHDVAYRPHEITGGLQEKAQLDEFLRLATEAGYEFSTLDKFYSD